MIAELTDIMLVMWVFMLYVIRAVCHYSDCLESKRCFAAKPDTVDNTNKESTAITWKTTA
tara:strand:+ start:1212 stop:1391 length:180 start_codon:yes stop_codon:yes gene_type:complete